MIADVLDAGTCAPSAANLQNWIFIVVKDEEKRHAIAQDCLKQFWMNEAPVHIVVCNDKSKVNAFFPDRGDLYSSQACALAAQNIMLKAEELGLGTCWVGGFDVNAIQRLLKIPEDIVPESVITLGYPEHFEKPLRRDAVSTATFFESYGNKSDLHSIFPLRTSADRLGKHVGKESTTVVKELKDLFKRLVR